MRGIETYRFLPAADGGVLGRGKFSTVYKVTDTEGKEVRPPSSQSARLATSRKLRTVCAQAHGVTPSPPSHRRKAAQRADAPGAGTHPPMPGWRTRIDPHRGPLLPHRCVAPSGKVWYVGTDLTEQYAASHIPLSSHPTRLKPTRAAYILDQLVSVTRDCLHSGGRVVHRDLKGDNILIDVRTGDLLLLGEFRRLTRGG